jgi:hypothetical protein
MAAHPRLLRFGLGASSAVLLSLLCFSIAFSWIPRWGATPEEVERTLPGDDSIPQPLMRWTNAVSIAAPPDQVWPWIAQLGDNRGGFYSYTFIENNLSALAPDYQVEYHNASVPVAAWQSPTPGDQVIQGILHLTAVQPGEWMLAEAVDPQTLQWTWLWFLEPQAGGSQTRLLVRFMIDVPPEMESPAVTWMMTTGGFVMQQRMLQGIKLRAQGGLEPAYYEGLEISIWLSVLVIGVFAAGLTVFQQHWKRALLLGNLALLVLFFITFVQPDVVLRLLLLALLLLMLMWVRSAELFRYSPSSK